HLIDSLHREFDMTDLGALNYFLGIFAVCHSTGLHLYASSTTSLVGYTDADWAGCPSTRKSTSGYCVFLGDNLLSWSAKRQHTLSRSSAEAEYWGVANIVAETTWLRNLLREPHSPLSTATLVYCDNISAVYMSANPVQHQQTKHIEIDIHFVRDMVTAGQVRVLHVPSRYQYADIFTKGLPSALYGNGGKCVGDKQVVWMTHGDEAVKVSNEFQAVVIVCSLAVRAGDFGSTSTYQIQSCGCFPQAVECALSSLNVMLNPKATRVTFTD
ncbi:ribonuclease H-like domain-containing protein, partial [Tanacetum coccineum]